VLEEEEINGWIKRRGDAREGTTMFGSIDKKIFGV
jgi:hypothetical protein